MTTFKQTNKNIESGHLLGHVNATYTRLVELFGQPANNCLDDYKVSTQWILEHVPSGKQVYIYDYKMTDCYDSLLPTPDQFRMNTNRGGYDWHIGGEYKELVNELIEYVNSTTEPIRVSRNDLRDSAINRLISIRNRTNESKTSDRYAPLDSVHLYTQSLRLLREQGLTNVTTEIKVPNGRGTHHFIELTLNDLSLGIDGGLTPKLIISNSYNGESMARVNIGIFRFVCSNGLVFSDSYFSEAIRHINGPQFEIKVDGLEPAIAAALNEIRTNLVNQVSRLREVRLTEVEQLRLLFTLGLSDSILSNAIALFNLQNTAYGRANDRPRNLWTFFNIVNEAISQSSRSPYAIVRKNLGLLESIETNWNQLAA